MQTAQDVIVIGSGMGGLSAAALLAKAGRQVLVLEQNYLPGGCCSSYWRKGYVFETGATTLVGLDEHQPLKLLLDELGLSPSDGLYMNAQPLEPAMCVWLEGKPILRHRDRATWLRTVQQHFGRAEGQIAFWNTLFELNDFVWEASARNRHFPITSVGDLLKTIASNPPRDWLTPRWAFVPLTKLLKKHGLDSDKRFIRFLNEQLMITAQNTVEHVPVLFAAPALCYTNSTNYYLPGGLICLPFELMAYIGRHGGDVRLRLGVQALKKVKAGWVVELADGRALTATDIVTNLPVWNMANLTEGKVKQFFQKGAQQADTYWSAFTMGIVTHDDYAKDIPLHHQIHLPAGETLPNTGSHSVFVSMSARGDTLRAPNGERVLAISTHDMHPKRWFQLSKDDYATQKAATRERILQVLEMNLPGFSRDRILYDTDSSPTTWDDWLQRHEGTVGGLPQRLDRPIYSWPGAKTPFKGLYRTGDTVYPGQGIPGVTLGGMLAAERLG